MVPLLRQIRFPNLLIIALTFYSYRYFILEPFYHQSGEQIWTSSFDYAIMVITTMLIAAAGYLVNDYCDIDIDRVNCPDRPSVSGSIKPGSLFTGAVLLSILALIGILLLSSRMQSLIPLIVLITALITVWAYAFWLKKSLFLGNLSVAFMSSLTLGMAWLFEWINSGRPSYNLTVSGMIPWTTTGIIVFAFLLTLMREIVKDMEDLEGDSKFGCRTLPIAMGIPFSTRMLWILALFTMLLLIPAQVYLWKTGFIITALWLVPMIQLPQLIFIYSLTNSGNKSDYHKLSHWIKWTMVGGISSIIVIGLTVSLNHSN